MAGTLPKRVVFKKPKIKQPINTNEYGHINKDSGPAKPVKPSTDESDDLIDIPEEPQTIIHTESKKSIIVKAEPKKSEQKKSVDSPLPKKIQTFDDKVMDRINITSSINKDEKTLKKIKKEEIKPTRKTKQKIKRKLTPMLIVSLILSMIMIVWSFKIVTDYLSNLLDGSLASFVYMMAMILFTLLLFIWFIIELTIGDKK